MIGSIVFESVGFAWTFIIFGIVFTPIAALIMCLTKPSEVKARRDAE